MPPRQNRTEATEAPKNLSRRVLVNVKRDQTTATPRIVWAHELPILEAIFGEGNVDLIDPSTMDEGYSSKQSAALLPFNKKQDTIRKPSEVAGIGFVFTGDAQGEYERLASVYGYHPEVKQPWVENVYGRFQTRDFERILGLADFSDMPDAQLRQLIEAHGHIPIVGMDASPEERKEAEAVRAQLFAMPRAELLNLAEEVVGATV